MNTTKVTMVLAGESEEKRYTFKEVFSKLAPIIPTHIKLMSFSKSFKLISHYQHYPQLRLCSLLILLLGVLGLGTYLFASNQHQQVALERYGQLLATSAARQAIDATLSQDMVSLQAILQETAQQNYVIGASIHNTKNQLIVQSGYKPHENTQVRRATFSAPIALHNNVAGYLEVTLEMPRFSSADLIFIALWLCAVMGCLIIIGWSIQRRWWSSLRDKIPNTESVIQKVVENIQQLPTIAEAEPEPEAVIEEELKIIPNVHAARLEIHLLNLEKLYAQLNTEAFTQVLNRIEKQSFKLIKLYNGANASLFRDRILIEFHGEDIQEACFRGICFAQLLINAAQLMPSPKLQMSAIIYPLRKIQKSQLVESIETDVSFHRLDIGGNFYIQQAKPQAEKSVIRIHQQLLDVALLQLVDVDIETGTLLQIKAPFADFVKKQEEQLQL